MAKVKETKKTPDASKHASYEAKDIYVLEGLEPVRKRPGMYIGTTDSAGLHHLIWEVVDNSIDEAMAGYATAIKVELLPGNRVAVTDNGRGIPVDIHKQTKKSALETVMTTLHAGGKFGGDSYKVSGGLHGVGVSVVNALSIYLKAEVCRDGYLYEQEYERGKAKKVVKRVGKCDQIGTKVIFEPDPEIFSTGGGEIKFDWKYILDHLRQQAFLTKGVRIDFWDLRTDAPKYYALKFDGGLLSFLRHLTPAAKVLQDDPFYIQKSENNIEVEVAFTYTEDIESKELSFANNIYTSDGGMHSTGFKSALSRAINSYARTEGYLKEKDDNLTGDDVREGLVAVISVKLSQPQFEGQTKARLGTPEARTVVESVVSESLKEFLEKHPADARRMVEKCLLAAKARKAAKAAKDTVLRKGILEGLTLPGKLADCSSRDPAESELFIVEGDSAGGCFSGNTKVSLADGRNLSFKDLVHEDKKGIQNYCYTIDKDGAVAIQKIVYPRITKKNTEVVKVVLDNGEEIICTPDHEFMLLNGSYKKARDLLSQDSLMPLYKKISKIGGRITIDGYEMVFNSQNQKWIFTHMLSDDYNLKNNIYEKSIGAHRHHIDFNKLNNNPENITRLSSEDHLGLHRKMADIFLRSPQVLEKLRLIRQTPEYRNKIRASMSTPQMRKMLSERAQKQWQDKDYKQFMTDKFLDFYHNNAAYRAQSASILSRAQKEYWSEEKNRRDQANRTRAYFENHPEKRLAYSEFAKIQWNDEKLKKWRSGKTKDQWTPEFRLRRKLAYNETYKQKALQALRGIYETKGEIDFSEYENLRKATNDKNLLRAETIVKRFFGSDARNLVEAVERHNHKIKEILWLNEKVDVYDLEVPKTHNFALASGVFVHNSGKMGRDRRTQAILPLRGKILNVEKSRIDKMLANKEIRALVMALGTAIAQDFNIEKIRYHKIVIMTDADVDGAHIRTLLLTLFYRYFPQVIHGGYLYIAQPPLFRIQSGKEVQYAYNENEKEAIIVKFGKARAGKHELKEAEKADAEEAAGDRRVAVNVQRYKGLGEMNPDQLWDTTMNPATRKMLVVTVKDAEDADKLFDILMGDEVEPRKQFIQTHAAGVKNLDI
ncbi:MAG: DNA topoisomerase (ATP-hydrolyzing) subunit B [Candidatus Liptonbacteria bacterium]|nr:DNA topoisomerase (ATP-hydrolyzing) subunit B [Candidatus Liptonbacteria bacterium]